MEALQAFGLNMSNLKFIFVHGLSGWGSYDRQNRLMPYWGMRGGDLIAWLNRQGFESRSASVAPAGSAWDRACELYAQLAGCRTDYGAQHAAEYRHGRFGRDFSSEPLLKEPLDDCRLVLIGHSFGGATVRLFAELMAHGCAAERAAPDHSPLFDGGRGSLIHAVVAIAAPHNGTTAYDLHEDPAFSPEAIEVPAWTGMTDRMLNTGTKEQAGGRDPRDTAGFDMHIDNAIALNRVLPPLPETYYFSVPCTCSRLEGSVHVPIQERMEPMFVKRSFQIGAYTGTTKGGVTVDEAWLENDGLVNLISARCPFGAPAQDFDAGHIAPGVWNILPVFHGDHMSLQGGLLRKTEVRSFYRELLTTIRRLDM